MIFDEIRAWKEIDSVVREAGGDPDVTLHQLIAMEGIRAGIKLAQEVYKDEN